MKQKESTMSTGDRFNRLDNVTLKGRNVPSENNDVVLLEADGALISVRKEDIRELEDLGEGILMLRVNASARILFETLLTPHEAGGILSREALIEIRAEPTECSRCSTECSRPPPTECSRCSTEFGNFSSGGSGVFRRRLA